VHVHNAIVRLKMKNSLSYQSPLKSEEFRNDLIHSLYTVNNINAGFRQLKTWLTHQWRTQLARTAAAGMIYYAGLYTNL